MKDNIKKLKKEIRQLNKELKDINIIFYACMMGDENDLSPRLKKKAEEITKYM